MSYFLHRERLDVAHGFLTTLGPFASAEEASEAGDEWRLGLTERERRFSQVWIEAKKS